MKGELCEQHTYLPVGAAAYLPTHQLEALGNGQVPLQAAAAWMILINHFK